MAEPAHPLKLASLLLQYPSAELWGVRQEIEAEVAALPRGRSRSALERFLDRFGEGELGEHQRAYVETFDFSRRNSLHLSYHRWGDLRQRGLALARLKERYAAAGFELAGGELPDYLPVMLEFCALGGADGVAALGDHREALELVRSSLREEGSPYADLLDAAVAELPRLTRGQAARAARLAKDGPPSEEVGLEPFAPPEVMPPSDPAGFELAGGSR
jgi:nitrate reductase molybdenum cofactor assembly chaperone NarJ/NarW